jgi:TniQ
MKVEVLEICEALDLTAPALSTRSRLYHLEPIGIGAPYVECLTSYFGRLALAHGVSTAWLFRTELDPLLCQLKPADTEYTSNQASRQSLMYGANYANGNTVHKGAWVKALESLTLRRDLRYLTTSPWGMAISHCFLIRKSLAWCACCYEEWRGLGAALYEPLLWALRDVTVCPRHNVYLRQVCPHCKEKLRFLSSNKRSGYCPWCYGWLGSDEKTEGRSQPRGSEFERQAWEAASVADWIEVAQKRNSPPAKELLQTTLLTCIDQITDGRVNTFAKLMDSEAIRRWGRGKSTPRLDTILNICFVLGTTLTDFLSGQVIVDGVFKSSKSLNEIRRLAPSTSSGNQEKVLQALNEALEEDPPPTVEEVARRLGYGTGGALRVRFLERCQQISMKNKAWRASRPKPVYNRRKNAEKIGDKEKSSVKDAIKRTIERALAEEYPPSVPEIAWSLNFKTGAALRGRFPDLCRSISSKRAEYRKEQSRRRIEEKLKTIMNEDPPVSLWETARRLGFKSPDTLREKFKEECRAIIKRHSERKRARDEAVRLKLLPFLEEEPPRPLKRAAEILSLPMSYLYKDHRDLCVAISSRHTDFIKESKAKSIEALKADVRRIIVEIEGRGEYPTVEYILSLIDSPFAEKPWIEAKVIREVKHELNSGKAPSKQ